MTDSRVVLIKIAGMFLVILAGWLARRRGYLSQEAGSILSRIVVDAAFPALVFTQMLRTVDATVQTGLDTAAAPPSPRAHRLPCGSRGVAPFRRKGPPQHSPLPYHQPQLGLFATAHR